MLMRLPEFSPPHLCYPELPPPRPPPLQPRGHPLPLSPKSPLNDAWSTYAPRFPVVHPFLSPLDPSTAVPHFACFTRLRSRPLPSNPRNLPTFLCPVLDSLLTPSKLFPNSPASIHINRPIKTIHLDPCRLVLEPRGSQRQVCTLTVLSRQHILFVEP